MDITQQLGLWADRLRAITGNGLHFARNPYDEANYRQVRQIAAEMFALIHDRPGSEVEGQLQSLLGHYTPMVMGDALVINDAGHMLLIQRTDSGLWAAPGGAFDVGETAAQGAVRECFEETGWRVMPVALIGLYDSRLVGTRVGHHVYHLSFLCRPLAQASTPPSHAQEVLNMGWFPENALPALDAGHRVWVPQAFRYWRGEVNGAYFDPLRGDAGEDELSIPTSRWGTELDADADGR
jgi:8-oxo-dGTP pyrophosphatase MutT (NUDIX family)